MPDTKQLGVFWEEEALYFVETVNEKPKKFFSVPIDEETRKAIQDGPFGPSMRKFVSGIQSTIKREEITASKVNLALSSGDIIFRSFTIPFMTQNEISSVVEFEASKYIPFSLAELSFYFHPIFLKTEHSKKIRVIFAGVKKSSLKNYVKILEEASLEVDAVEPASSALIRALAFTKVLPENQTTALITIDKTGRIIVFDNLVPHFVREFYSANLSTPQPHENPEDFLKRLTREIRISLDYFNRQNEHLQIKQIFLITSSNTESLVENLEKSLTLPTIIFNQKADLFFEQIKNPETLISYLNAFGVCLISSTNSVASFNLIKKGKTEKSHSTNALPKKPLDFKLILKTAILCIPIIVAALVGKDLLTVKYRNEINGFQEKLGAFASLEKSVIETQNAGLKSKLEYFQKTNLITPASSLIMLAPDLLPEGTWLDRLEIVYDDSFIFNMPNQDPNAQTYQNGVPTDADKPLLTMTFFGYAFSEDQKSQFQLVNNTLRNLKDSKEFSVYFDTIDLDTTMAKQLQDHSVTAFQIICRKNYESQRSQ